MSTFEKYKAPIWVGVACAGFMIIVQTIANSVAVIGYDEVVRAHATKIERELLAETDKDLAIDFLEKEIILLNKTIVNNKKAADIRFKALEKKSHDKR